MILQLRQHSSSLAFLLTGVGTALLGSTLPATLHEWHLSDNRGGLLLLSSWSGSTLGAALVRSNALLSAVAGLALSAGALLALSVPTPFALGLCFFAFGLGLGLAMTAISMLRSQGVSPARANVELNHLNLLWAAGACLAPALALRSLHLLQVSVVFRTAAVAFAVCAALLAASAFHAQPREVIPGLVATVGGDRPLLPWAPARFCLFAAASVGLESALGSWLTTYAARGTHDVALAVSANAAFWAGLLLSRAAHTWVAAGWLHGAASRWAHIAAAGLATLLLLAVPGKQAVPFAALLGGLGLGPLYPHVLSVSIPRYRSNPVFILAGVGASVVPWATGVLSSALGSLRLGLLAAAGAFLLLLASAFQMRAEPV